MIKCKVVECLGVKPPEFSMALDLSKPINMRELIQAGLRTNEHFASSLLEASEVLKDLLKEYGRQMHPDLAVGLDELRTELLVSAGKEKVKA